MDTPAQLGRWAGTATTEARALPATWVGAAGPVQKANQGLQDRRGQRGWKEHEARRGLRDTVVRWATAGRWAHLATADSMASEARLVLGRLVHKVRVDPWDTLEPQVFLGRWAWLATKVILVSLALAGGTGTEACPAFQAPPGARAHQGTWVQTESLGSWGALAHPAAPGPQERRGSKELLVSRAQAVLLVKPGRVGSMARPALLGRRATGGWKDLWEGLRLRAPQGQSACPDLQAVSCPMLAPAS